MRIITDPVNLRAAPAGRKPTYMLGTRRLPGRPLILAGVAVVALVTGPGWHFWAPASGTSASGAPGHWRSGLTPERLGPGPAWDRDRAGAQTPRSAGPELLTAWPVRR